MSKAYEERSRWRTVNLEEPPAALKITQHLARCDLLMHYADLYYVVVEIYFSTVPIK